MAVYKVPQDVEAEDKLIAWLSFRQFIYLMIACGAAAIAFFIVQIFPLLIIIPLPIILLFGMLALPLKKDQPLETYLLAIIRFYLKPKLRMWNPDGTITYVEITAPKFVDQQLSKNYGGDSAKERLDYLARIMDSRGWAYKGVDNPTNDSVTSTVAAEAQSAVDVLDDQADISRSFENLITKKQQQQRQDVMQQMQSQGQPAAQATPTATQQTTADDVVDDTTPTPTFNPYPTNMHQKVVRPLGDQPPPQPAAKKTAPPAVTPAVSPDIMRLAGNKDLTVSALAHEARRLEAKEGEEIVINLH